MAVKDLVQQAKNSRLGKAIGNITSGARTFAQPYAQSFAQAPQQMGRGVGGAIRAPFDMYYNNRNAEIDTSISDMLRSQERRFMNQGNFDAARNRSALIAGTQERIANRQISMGQQMNKDRIDAVLGTAGTALQLFGAKGIGVKGFAGTTALTGGLGYGITRAMGGSNDEALAAAGESSGKALQYRGINKISDKFFTNPLMSRVGQQGNMPVRVGFGAGVNTLANIGEDEVLTRTNENRAPTTQERLTSGAVGAVMGGFSQGISTKQYTKQVEENQKRLVDLLNKSYKEDIAGKELKKSMADYMNNFDEPVSKLKRKIGVQSASVIERMYNDLKKTGKVSQADIEDVRKFWGIYSASPKLAYHMTNEEIVTDLHRHARGTLGQGGFVGKIDDTGKLNPTTTQKLKTLDKTAGGMLDISKASQDSLLSKKPSQRILTIQGTGKGKKGIKIQDQSYSTIITEARKEIGETKEKKAPTIRKIADDLYTQWVNRFAPVERASTFVKDTLKTQGAELRPENDPQYLLRRFTGAGGIATARFKNELKPVIDQLEKLKIDKLDMDVYLKAKRDIGLADRNIYGSDSNQASARVVALMEKYPGIDEISGQLYKYQNDGFKEMIDAGFLSKESGDIIKQQNPDYVPFQRVMDDLDNYLGVPSNKLQQGTQPIQKIKGSKRQIESPIESIIANTFKQRAAIEKNRVAKSIVDLQKIVPDIGFEQVKKSTPETITVWRDGEKEFWKVGTDIADTVKATNEESINTLLQIFQAPASLLRQGATGRNPDFLIPNIIKDQFDAAIASKYGYIPFVDFVSGFRSMLGNDDIYKRWESSGAKIDLGELSGRKSIKQSFDQATKRKGLFDWLVTGLDALGTLSEVPTRVGLFKRAYKKTGNELIAALESRDSTVDFARMGSKMKIANSIIPFLNVGVQGFDKLIRQSKSNPGKLALNAGLFAGIPAITTTLYNLNNYSEEYAEIPQFVKDSNFVIVMGRNEDGTVDYFTLPKGNIAPLITNPLENFLAYAYGQNDQSFGEFTTRFISSALPVVGDGSSVKEIATKTIGQNLPQLIKPPIESLLNRSFYKYDRKKEQSKEIVPTYLNKKEPHRRHYEWTPTLYKKVGAVLNVSPLSVQHLAESYLAGYIKVPNQIIGMLEGVANGKEIRKNDIPIGRRFFSTTFPTSPKREVVRTQKETPFWQRVTGKVSESEKTSPLITKEIRDEIKEKVKYSEEVSQQELETAYLNQPLTMPQSNRYEKSKRDGELYSSLSTIDTNEYLTEQQKTALKGKVASELGKTPQDLQIYSVAKEDNDSKTMYAYDQIEKSTSFDDTMSYLVNGRKPINGKILVSDGVINNLVADGVIPYALGKDIKDIDLNEDGSRKGTIKSRGGRRSKGGSSKKSKASQLKAFNELGENLKKIKIGTSKIRTTQSRRINTKGLTFSGK